MGMAIPGDHLVALGILAPGGDLAVLPDDELPGEAVGEHVFVVIGVIEGEDQGLFPLRQVQGVAHHFGGAVLAGDLAPYVGDIHQDVAPVVDALEDLAVLVGRYHIVVDAVCLAVAVKGQLRVGHHRVEKQVLHNAVIGRVGDAVPGTALRHDGGIIDVIGLRLGLLFRDIFLGRTWRLLSVISGGGRAAAGGQG